MKYWAMFDLNNASSEEQLTHRPLQDKEEDKLFERCKYDVVIGKELKKELVVDLRKTWGEAKQKVISVAHPMKKRRK